MSKLITTVPFVHLLLSPDSVWPSPHLSDFSGRMGLRSLIFPSFLVSRFSLITDATWLRDSGRFWYPTQGAHNHEKWYKCADNTRKRTKHTLNDPIPLKIRLELSAERETLLSRARSLFSSYHHSISLSHALTLSSVMQ